MAEYRTLGHGQRGPWLTDQGLSPQQIKAWENAVLKAELLEQSSQADETLDTLRAEVAKLNARVFELEQTNAMIAGLLSVVRA
jgi:hypothetical protein